MRHLAGVAEAYAGVGDVDRPIATDRHVIQKDRPHFLHLNRRDHRARVLIEGPHRVDVGDPERVADDDHSLGSIQRHTLLTAANEHGLRRGIGRVHTNDETIVVLLRRDAVDVADEVGVERRVVAYALGNLESFGRCGHGSSNCSSTCGGRIGAHGEGGTVGSRGLGTFAGEEASA